MADDNKILENKDENKKDKPEKKKSIKKREFDFESMQNKFSTNDSYRPLEWLYMGDVFQKATGIHLPLGHTIQVMGWSNTGKSTVATMAAIAAQKRNILPVFIITEQKFSFEHAQQMGLECEKRQDANGKEYWAGFLLYKLGFEYIEQIFEYINELLDAQKKDDIPYDLLFIWDSVGTIPCKMTYDGKGGTQHTARVIHEKWGQSLAQKINASNKETSKYRNTAVIINQPWFELPDSPVGKGRIQPKGGQAIYFSSSIVLLCGNQKSAGTSLINLTHNKRTVNFGIRTKLTVMKNHINGLGYADSRVISVPHGFIEDTKEAMQEYKAKYSQYWADILQINASQLDTEVETSEEEIIDTDIDYYD